MIFSLVAHCKNNFPKPSLESRENQESSLLTLFILRTGINNKNTPQCSVNFAYNKNVRKGILK